MKNPVLRFFVILTICIGIIVAPFLLIYAFNPRVAYVAAQCFLLLILLRVTFRSGKRAGKGEYISPEDLPEQTLFMISKSFGNGFYLVGECSETTDPESFNPPNLKFLCMLHNLSPGQKFIVSSKKVSIKGMAQKATPLLQDVMTIPI